MSRAINLADPDFEPTDEELQRLAHEAFADVAKRRAETAVHRRAHIEELRGRSLSRLREILAALAPASSTEPT